MSISIIERIVRVFAPHKCVGCETEEDKLLCEVCMRTLTTVPSRCYCCKAATKGYEVCASCSGNTPLSQVVVRTRYQGLARELLHHMKYERAQSGIYEMAALLTPLLDVIPEEAVLTYIPTATSRVRMRGYDHARLLARALSRSSTLPFCVLLGRIGQAHQVGSSRAERLEQLHGVFRPVHSKYVSGKHVVLVDDVLTTGATLETAARTLKHAGAQSVSAIVFAEA